MTNHLRKAIETDHFRPESIYKIFGAFAGKGQNQKAIGNFSY